MIISIFHIVEDDGLFLIRKTLGGPLFTIGFKYAIGLLAV
jgi:hypothetical protein